jgi:carboxyl-terminal processing protease
MKLKLFCLLLLCFPLFAKAPDLSANDVKSILNQIFKEHAKYKAFDEKLAERSLKLFIDELDPTRMYFIRDEIIDYLEPSKALQEQVVQEFHDKSFKTYFKLFALMRGAIYRKEEYTKAIKKEHLPILVDIKEFKKPSFCKNRAELIERLLRIKGLQYQMMKKLDKEAQDTYLERIEKYERHFEEEILDGDEKAQKNYVFSRILKSIAPSLDNHTYYFTPFEANQFMFQVQGKLFGIGAQLREDFNGLLIIKVLQGGPCEKEGTIKPDDLIVAVDSEPIVGKHIVDAVSLIRGEKGKPVKLTIMRKDKQGKENTFDIKIVRDEVVIEESRLEKETIPYGEGVIGCLKLHSFYEDETHSSAKDIAKGIKEMQKQNLHGVILDLRDNTGGLLSPAIDLTSLFIKKGVVVSMRDNEGQIRSVRNLNSEPVFDGPLVILTNRFSASGSEIIAQSLQDYKRCVVVGERTFGKGTAQIFTLDGHGAGKVNPKGEFKVTKGVYYTVSGKSPQLTGVIPDIEVLGITHGLESVGEDQSKYPLENDSIAPSFEDEMGDVPFFQRQRIKELYKMDQQKPITVFSTYFDLLKKNSKERITKDKEYQAFLKKIECKDWEHLSQERDHQKEEAINILKDLIFITNVKPAQAA